MLPKKRRIARKDFLEIFLKGKKYNSPTLLLCLSQMEDKTKDSRFSFSVSKKICSSAVCRNKNRRRGYSIIFKKLDKIKPGYCLFFSFKKKQPNPSFVDLEKEIEGLLSSSLVLR